MTLFKSIRDLRPHRIEIHIRHARQHRPCIHQPLALKTPLPRSATARQREDGTPIEAMECPNAKGGGCSKPGALWAGSSTKTTRATILTIGPVGQKLIQATHEPAQIFQSMTHDLQLGRIIQSLLELICIVRLAAESLGASIFDRFSSQTFLVSLSLKLWIRVTLIITILLLMPTNSYNKCNYHFGVSYET
jgi:hypothetical protein